MNQETLKSKKYITCKLPVASANQAQQPSTSADCAMSATEALIASSSNPHTYSIRLIRVTMTTIMPQVRNFRVRVSFSTNLAISETKCQGWRAIATQ